MDPLSPLQEGLGRCPLQFLKNCQERQVQLRLLMTYLTPKEFVVLSHIYQEISWKVPCED